MGTCSLRSALAEANLTPGADVILFAPAVFATTVRRFAERWIAGLAGGYARSELDFDGLAGDAHADTAQGAAYAGCVSPLFEVGANFRFAWKGMHATRDIDFPPPSTLSRSADSDFDGIDLGGHAEAALNLWEASGLAVQPVASLSYAHLQQDSFEETGAGSLSIDADEQEIDSVASGLGLRARSRYELGEELWLHLELRALAARVRRHRAQARGADRGRAGRDLQRARGGDRARRRLLRRLVDRHARRQPARLRRVRRRGERRAAPAFGRPRRPDPVVRIHTKEEGA